VRMRVDDLGALLAGDVDAGPHFAFADILDERFVTDGRLAAICSSARTTCRLYDLAADPGERLNLAPERPADVARLRSAIAGFVASIPRVEALALGEGGAWPEALARAALGDRSQGPALTRLLGSSRPAVRRGAARELGELAYAPAADSLSRLGRSDPDADVRAEAAIAAYGLGDETLAPALRSLARGEVEGGQARRAAFALGGRADPAARGVLLALALDSSAEEQQRQRAIRVLPEVPGPGLVEGLARLLADVRLRTPAAEALGRLGDRRAIAPLRAALASERYLPARAAEARALVELGDRRVLAQVRRFLGMDVPIPGGLQILLDLDALRPPTGADLRRQGRAREGAFLCDEVGCLAGDSARLRLPGPRPVPERLVLAFHVPEGGGVVHLGQDRFELPAGEPELSLALDPHRPPTLGLRTEGELRVLAFVVVPAQEEIPAPAPEPWDAGTPDLRPGPP